MCIYKQSWHKNVILRHKDTKYKNITSFHFPVFGVKKRRSLLFRFYNMKTPHSVGSTNNFVLHQHFICFYAISLYCYTAYCEMDLSFLLGNLCYFFSLSNISISLVFRFRWENLYLQIWAITKKNNMRIRKRTYILWMKMLLEMKRRS